MNPLFLATVDAHWSGLFLQLLFLAGVLHIAGSIARKLNLPTIAGYLLGGLAVSPSALGRYVPHLTHPGETESTMLSVLLGVAVFGVLLGGGYESAPAPKGKRNLSDGKRAFVIGVVGVIVPVAIAFGLTFAVVTLGYAPAPGDPLMFSAFLSVVMSISALVVITVVMRQTGLMGTHLKRSILWGYAWNDIISWVAFGLLFGAYSRSTAGSGNVMPLVCATLLGVLLCLTVGSRLVHKLMDHAKSAYGDAGAWTVVVASGLALGYLTASVDLSPHFGFFVAGLMCGGTELISEENRQRYLHWVEIAVPFYFASIALHLDLLTHFNLFIVVYVSVVSLLAKYFGAYLGALCTKLVGENMTRLQRKLVGVAFTPGGVTGIILGERALQLGILDEQWFVGIVFSTIVSVFFAGPMINHLWGMVDLGSLVKSFVPNLDATTREGALQALCAIASKSTNKAAQDLLRAAMERECSASTYVGEHIAIPHAKVPGITRSQVFVATCNITGWGHDDNHVTLVIFVVSPSEPTLANRHIRLLAAISRRLINRRIVERLMWAEEVHDVRAILGKVGTRAA